MKRSMRTIAAIVALAVVSSAVSSNASIPVYAGNIDEIDPQTGYTADYVVDQATEYADEPAVDYSADFEALNTTPASLFTPLAKSSNKPTIELDSYTIYLGNKQTLTPSVSGLKWKSKSKKIATVSVKKGVMTITPKKAGETEIYATDKTNKYVYKVTVLDPVSIDCGEITVEAGDEFNLWLNYDDNDSAYELGYSSDTKVKWASSKKKVAAVKNGSVTAKKAGKATITATYKKRKYKCKVTVTKATTPGIKKIVKGKKTAEVSNTSGGVAGVLSDDNYTVNIPAGTFAENTNVTITPMGKSTLRISAEGKEYARLDEPVKISIKLDGPVADKDLDKYRGVYYFEGQKIYTDPDFDKLRQGILEYEIYHFSDHGAEMLSRSDEAAAVAYKEALIEISRDEQNQFVKDTVEDMFMDTIKAMGVVDEEKQKDFLKKFSKGTQFIALARAAAEGNETEFTKEATNVILNTIAENPNAGYFVAGVGSASEVYECLQKGDTAGAATAVAKAVTSNIPVVKYTQFAAQVCSTTIDYYVNCETDAAYKVYYNLLNDGESGYSMRNGFGWSVIEKQMACPLRQMKIKAMEDYAKAKGVSVNSLDNDERNKIESMVKNNLIKQFEARYARQKEIEERQEKTQKLFAEFEKVGLLNRGDANVGFGRDDDLTIRLNRLLHLRDTIEGMLDGKDFADMSGFKGMGTVTKEMREDFNRKKFAEFVSIWVENAWTGGRHAPDGERAVRQALAEQYGIGLVLSKNAITLDAGNSETLELIGAPGTVKWASSDKTVATVSEDGVVTGIKAGTARIRARYGKASYYCTVTVIGVGVPTLVPSTVKLAGKGSSKNIYLKNVIDGDTANAEIIPMGSVWSKDDEDECIDIASSGDGGLTITAVKDIGNASVTINYDGVDYTCYVTVEGEAEGVPTLVPSTVKLAKKGDSKKIYLKMVKDGDTSNAETIPIESGSWRKEDEDGCIKVETTSDGGLKITAAKDTGKASVIVTYDKVDYTCSVTVEGEEEEGPSEKGKIKLNYDVINMEAINYKMSIKLYRVTGDKDIEANREYISVTDWTVDNKCVRGTVLTDRDGNYNYLYAEPMFDGTATISCMYSGVTYSCTAVVTGVAKGVAGTSALTVYYDPGRDPEQYQGQISIKVTGTGLGYISEDLDGKGISGGGGNDYFYLRPQAPSKSVMTLWVRSLNYDDPSMNKCFYATLNVIADEEKGKEYYEHGRFTHYVINLDSGAVTIEE